MGTEIWKDIPNYEGLYKASSLGRIMSCKKIWQTGNNTIRTKDDTMLKYNHSNCGYYRVGLSKNRKQIIFSVHRLVALTFIENRQMLPSVNHINGIKTDNSIENLEWCTNSYNVKHAFKLGLRKANMSNLGKKFLSDKFAKAKRSKSYKSKKVIDTITKKEWGCIKDCAEDLGLKYGTLVSRLNSVNKNNYHIKFLTS